MEKIIDKITSYHLFNYLLPGVLFVVMLDQITTYSFVQDNLIVGAFIYYFVGLVVSRIGSLVIEPILKRVGFLKFAKYHDFVSATKKDPKIDELSETNNMYRTFVSMLFLLLAMKGYEVLSYNHPFLVMHSTGIFLLSLLLMFLLAYRKQTSYIRERVGAANNTQGAAR